MAFEQYTLFSDQSPFWIDAEFSCRKPVLDAAEPFVEVRWITYDPRSDPEFNDAYLDLNSFEREDMTRENGWQALQFVYWGKLHEESRTHDGVIPGGRQQSGLSIKFAGLPDDVISLRAASIDELRDVIEEGLRRLRIEVVREGGERLSDGFYVDEWIRDQLGDGKSDA